MKKTKIGLLKSFAGILLFFASNNLPAQSPLDTIKPGTANDPMAIKPEATDDGIAVKPVTPNMRMFAISDTAFLAKNILDARLGIQLSKLAGEKAKTQAVKKIAEQMIKDHSEILAVLMKLAPKTSAGALNKLNEPALPRSLQVEDFDAAWAGLMLRMHELKIEEMETFINMTNNLKLKEVILRTIPKIKMHREVLLQVPGAKEKSKVSRTA